MGHYRIASRINNRQGNLHHTIRKWRRIFNLRKPDLIMRNNNLSAKEFCDYENAATREHHLRRIIWLSSPSPEFSCGEKIPSHLALALLEASQQYLKGGLWGGRCTGELAPIPYRNDL
jgi:hypothetical protein